MTDNKDTNFNDQSRNRLKLRQIILSKICQLTNYNPEKKLYFYELIKNLKGITIEYLNGELLFLNQEGLIHITSMKDNNDNQIVTELKIYSAGIEYFESLKQGHENQKEFGFRNITNSQIIINSPHAKIITNNQEINELLQFFENILNSNSANLNLKDLSRSTIKKIKKGSISKDYLKAIGQAFLSSGYSVAGNFLTPTIASLLGIPSP